MTVLKGTQMKTIDCLPESISLKQVLEACAVLGLDPERTRSITLGSHWAEVTVYASKPVQIKSNSEDPALHTVYYDTLAEPSGDD